MRLVLLGTPSSGKGSMASYLKQLLNVPHISTGDIFRYHIKSETELGLKVKSFINNGQLVPDELTIALVRDRLEQADASSGFIFDGFPRTVTQAEALDQMLGKIGVELDMVLDLEVPDEVVIERAISRRLCPQCGRIYNTISIKPIKENHCDVCDVELISRSDDSREIMTDRLLLYHDQTAPLLDYYQTRGILRKMVNTVSSDESKRIVKEIVEQYCD